MTLLSIRVQQHAIERAIEQAAEQRRFLSSPAAIYADRRPQPSAFDAQQSNARTEGGKPRLLMAEDIYRRRRAAATSAE